VQQGHTHGPLGLLLQFALCFGIVGSHTFLSFSFTHGLTFAITPALLYLAFSSSPLSTASFSITMAFLACWWCSALSSRFLTAALRYTGKDSVTQRASECISACADGFISVFRIPRKESPPKKGSRPRISIHFCLQDPTLSESRV